MEGHLFLIHYYINFKRAQGMNLEELTHDIATLIVIIFMSLGFLTAYPCIPFFCSCNYGANVQVGLGIFPPILEFLFLGKHIYRI